MEEVEAQSASSSMGRKSKNRHPDNPNPKKPCKINAIHMVSMQVKKAQTIEHPTDYKKLCQVEVDSRADTCCAGATFKLITDMGCTADVEGFHGDLGKLEGIPIGTCYTAIDHLVLQETIIGVFHQCLYFGSQMEESLINPNQLRANGLVVDMCPKQYSNRKSLHGIYHEEDDLYIPFQMHGCTSYFSSRLPTQKEIADCRQIVFTSEETWDPYSQTFTMLEKAYENKERRATEGEFFTNAGADIHINIGATSSHNRCSTVDATALASNGELALKLLATP